MPAYGQAKGIEQTLQKQLELDMHKRQRKDDVETWMD